MEIAEHALYDKDANEVYLYIYNSNLNKLEKMAKITVSA